MHVYSVVKYFRRLESILAREKWKCRVPELKLVHSGRIFNCMLLIFSTIPYSTSIHPPVDSDCKCLFIYE